MLIQTRKTDLVIIKMAKRELEVGLALSAATLALCPFAQCVMSAKSKMTI